MANSWPAFVLFIWCSLIVFDLNHAADRRRRSLGLPNIFGRGSNVETTTFNIFQGKLGILSINKAGGQKINANNPCDPSQNAPQGSTLKPALINIKIPSLFSRGGNQPATPPPECPPTEVYPSENTNPSAGASTGGYQPESPQPKPVPPTQQPAQSSTSSLPPSSSDSSAVEATTVDVDSLIDSIFNEEEASAKPTENSGAGIIDLRWRGKKP